MNSVFKNQLKNIQYLLEKKVEDIPEEIKAKLPKGSKILAIHLGTDMYDEEYEAMMVQFRDPSGNRVANFRLSDGNYMDDFIL